MVSSQPGHNMLWGKGALQSGLGPYVPQHIQELTDALSPAKHTDSCCMGRPPVPAWTSLPRISPHFYLPESPGAGELLWDKGPLFPLPPHKPCTHEGCWPNAATPLLRLHHSPSAGSQLTGFSSSLVSLSFQQPKPSCQTQI